MTPRADENIVSDVFILQVHIGVDLGANDGIGGGFSSWGQAANLYIEGCDIGVRANSTLSSKGESGWHFSNLCILDIGTTSIQMNDPPAGYDPPVLAVTGGDWSGYVLPQRNDTNGQLWLAQIFGYTSSSYYGAMGWLDGRQPLIPTAPPVPPSSTPIANRFGFSVDVYVLAGTGATTTGITVGSQVIPGSAMAPNSTFGPIPLAANETIQIGYAAVAPTWKWHARW